MKLYECVYILPFFILFFTSVRFRYWFLRISLTNLLTYILTPMTLLYTVRIVSLHVLYMLVLEYLSTVSFNCPISHFKWGSKS